MSKEISIPLSTAATRESATNWLRAAGIAIAGSAFVAVCAHLSIPLYFTPVPLSLAPFAVLVLGLLLSPRLAGATLLAYLAEGAIGLPVFAPSPLTGIAHLLGPTGGYLLSYPLAAPLISILFRRTRRWFGPAFLSAGAGSLVILACGALWFMAITHAPIQVVVTQTVVPFLPGDALKVAAAAGIAVAASRLRRNNA